MQDPLHTVGPGATATQLEQGRPPPSLDFSAKPNAPPVKRGPGRPRRQIDLPVGPDTPAKRKPGRPPAFPLQAKKLVNRGSSTEYAQDVPADDPVRNLIKISRCARVQCAYFFLLEAWKLGGCHDPVRLKQHAGRRMIDASKLKISVKTATAGSMEEVGSLSKLCPPCCDPAPEPPEALRIARCCCRLAASGATYEEAGTRVFKGNFKLQRFAELVVFELR